MITGIPLIPGDSEIDQIFKIFKITGTPSENTWPGVMELPDMKKKFPMFKPTDLRKCVPNASAEAIDLLSKMLILDPNERATAEEVLEHPYFK
jgi:serine/threonine protein kinase